MNKKIKLYNFNVYEGLFNKLVETKTWIQKKAIITTKIEQYQYKIYFQVIINNKFIKTIIKYYKNKDDYKKAMIRLFNNNYIELSNDKIKTWYDYCIENNIATD